MQIRDEVAAALELDADAVHVTLRPEGARRHHDHRSRLDTIGPFGPLPPTGSAGDDQRTPVMRQLLLGLILLALGLPARRPRDVRVSAFYYPWYGTPAHDGAYQHWSQNGHTPPDDIASAYYPARGLYSSADRLVVGAQMDEIRAPGSTRSPSRGGGAARPRTRGSPLVVGAARADGIAVAAHLEPYAGRTVASTVADVAYLRRSAIRRSTSTARSTCRSPTGRRRTTRCTPAARRCSRRRRSSARRQPPASTASTRTTSSRIGGDKFARLLRRGARAASAVRAVGRAWLRRAPRQRRPRRQAAPERRDLRRDVARGDRRARRPRHDHVVQRVARGHADRARRAVEPARPLPLPLVRRRVGAARRSRPKAPTSPGRATGPTSSAARRRCSRRPKRLVDVRLRDTRAAAGGRGRRPRPATSSSPSAAAPSVEPNASSASTIEDAARAGLPARDALELAQLLERVDAHVRVGADAEPDPAMADARDRQEAVAEVRLGRRARRRCARPRRAAGRARARRRASRARPSCAGRGSPRARAARSGAGRARRGTRRSRAAARRRGRAAAARARRRSGRARASASAGHARTEWGATPTRSRPRAAPRARAGSRRPTPGGSGGCRRAGSTRRGRRTRSPASSAASAAARASSSPR